MDRERPVFPAPALRATCWGTRGSIPSPGPGTARYGGNTPCLEVRSADGRLFVFDAGTGIRALGRRLAEAGEPVRAELFLTHFHWDHIQGLPFFEPLYDRRTAVRIRAPRQGEADARTLLEEQMTPTHFPVPLGALAAAIEVLHLEEAPWTEDGVEVASFRVRHPGFTVGYRIRAGGRALAYIPDNELEGAGYPVAADWYERLLAFLAGVDLLFHDATFLEHEYPARRGWGHSTVAQAVRLAEDAGVPQLRLFHHAPDREDGDLDRIREEVAADLDRRGARLRVGVAEEGEEITLGGAGP